MNLFRLLLITALLGRLHGKILRLPCYSEAEFDVFYAGRRLFGSVLATYYETNDIQCTIQCVSHQKCRSYNINRSKNICEINDGNVSENSSLLRRDDEWIYKSTDYNRSLIGPVCMQLKPCESGILCQQSCSPPYYECVYCNEKFTGMHCDIPIEYDECASRPCINSDQCIDKINDYECKCRTGYTGKNCEIEIDECKSLPCFNGGTCTNLLGTFKCVCPPGFTGEHCEQDIDECASSPCKNEGTCTNLVNNYTCACPQGYSKPVCEDIDECATATHNCHANALCANSIGSFICTCNGGYTGDGRTCSDIDECASSPCKNGGFCTNQINRFTCACPPGFAEPVCEDIDECTTAAHNCHANALCTNSIGSFICTCNNGYDGDGRTCSENIALGKLSDQSSIHRFAGKTLVADFGNDGNRDGKWEVCAFTKNLHNPSWWRVNLGKVALVRYVIIRSGVTFAPLSINPFHISIGNDDLAGGTNNPKCVDGGTVLAGEVKKFNCPTAMSGRYATVFVTRHSFHQVCELEVYE